MRRLLHHRYLRRLVTFSAVFYAFVLLVTALPVWALVAAIASPFLPGKWRPLRLLGFLAVYLGLQVVGIVAAGALWVMTGFGHTFGHDDVRDVHYRLLGSLLDLLMKAAQRAFALGLDVGAPILPEDRPDVPSGPRPLLVFSRHAGPGDSFLLVHELMSVYGRRPRVVLKNTLQWDPMIDLLLNRIPSRFIAPNPTAEGVAESIGVLASDMTERDALVIFPEGGNYSEGRRLRAVERLERAGDTALAARAAGMRNLMAPRPGGAFAAIEAAPTADVVFVAHAGLEQLVTVRDLWRGLPMDADVRVQFWTVAAEDVPDGREERIDWLYDWWERIDAWVDEHR
jgi:1-acyl-sn-glycerol-3-phosphate acyltransferase